MMDTVVKQWMESYPQLPDDDARVIVNAAIGIQNQSAAVLMDIAPPPKGYFDSTVGWSILSDSSQWHLQRICQRLKGRCLEEHPTQRGMYRVSDEMKTVCKTILASL